MVDPVATDEDQVTAESSPDAGKIGEKQDESLSDIDEAVPVPNVRRSIFVPASFPLTASSCQSLSSVTGGLKGDR